MGIPATHSGKRQSLVEHGCVCATPDVEVSGCAAGSHQLCWLSLSLVCSHCWRLELNRLLLCGQRYECWVLVEGAVSEANGAVNVGDVLTAAFTVCEL